MMRVLLSLLIIFTASPVMAANFSGGYLMHVCAMEKDGSERVAGGHTACQAYIAGIIDYHNILKSLGTAPSADFCIPENENLYAIQKNVYRYLYNHRDQHGDFIASPGVGLALHKYYPCRSR